MSKFVPERLKEIIIVRGRKLDELAESVGVTKQAISKYTNGKNIPSRDVFGKLVRELNISPSFLMSEKPYQEKLMSPLFFRANSATTKTAKEFARTISGWGYEIAIAAGAIGLEPLPNIPENMNIYDKSLYIRNLWGLGTEPIDNMVSLLESHGIFVFTAESSELNTDAYSQIVCGVPIIVINKHKGSAVRQRFSLAHELGHLVLHNSISNTEFELNNKALEAEASTFANEFLLPSINYKEFIGTRNIEMLLPLKQNWKISLAAMLYHCKKKGLLSEIEAKRLQVQLSKKWGRMAEPFDDEIQNEKPSQLANKVMAIVKEQRDYEEFVNILSLPMKDVALLLSLPTGYFDQFTIPASQVNDQPDGIEQLTLFELEATTYA